MANPLFGQFGNQQANNPMAQFMSEFNHIKNTVQNPQAEVERLVRSGQLSQSDFNRLGQMANQIIGNMGRR